MAESDYQTVSFLTAEMFTESEYHLRSTAPTFPPAISSTKRTGTYGWDATGRTNGFGWRNHEMVLPATYRCGFWVRWNGLFTGDQQIFAVSASDMEDLLLYIVIDNVSLCVQLWQWDDGFSAFVMTGYSPAVDVLCCQMQEWHHVGVVCNVAAGWISVWANGRKRIHWTGLTLPVWPAALLVGNSSGSGNYVVYDDVYFDISTGSEADECPPNRRFYPVAPDGAGGASDFTPVGAANNWQCVDELPPDDDTTYVEALSNALMDMYTFADIASIPYDETPNAAALQVYCRMSSGVDGASGSLIFTYKGTGPADYGNKRRIIPNWDTTKEWSVLMDRFDAPSGSGEWDLTEFNGGEFGFETVDML